MLTIYWNFPDETYEEVDEYNICKTMQMWGVDTSGFFICMPLPGQVMFTRLLYGTAYLDKDPFNIGYELEERKHDKYTRTT